MLETFADDANYNISTLRQSNKVLCARVRFLELPTGTTSHATSKVWKLRLKKKK